MNKELANKSNSKVFHKLGKRPKGMTILILCLLLSIALAFHLQYKEAKAKEEISTLQEQLMKSEQQVHAMQKKHFDDQANIDALLLDSKAKDTVMLELLKNKKISGTYRVENDSLFNDNPIDDYFTFSNLLYPCTLVMNHTSYIYLGLWYEELDHSYDVLLSNAHEDLLTEYREAKENIIDYAYSSGELHSAFNFSSHLTKDQEKLTYGTIANSERALHCARILKEETLRVHSVLRSNGYTIDFIFDPLKLEEHYGKLFVDDDYMKAYYSITHDAITFYDEQHNITHVLTSHKPIELAIVRDHLLKVLVNQRDLYVYDIANGELSQPFEDVLYHEGSNVLHIKDGQLVLSYLTFSQLQKNVEGSWYHQDDPKKSIVSVERIGDYLQITYHHKIDANEMITFIKLF